MKPPRNSGAGHSHDFVITLDGEMTAGAFRQGEVYCRELGLKKGRRLNNRAEVGRCFGSSFGSWQARLHPRRRTPSMEVYSMCRRAGAFSMIASLFALPG